MRSFGIEIVISTDWFNPTISNIPQFPANQLYPFDIGLDGVDGRVGAFGDFNSDKL
jgi:hypothetical protein